MKAVGRYTLATEAVVEGAGVDDRSDFGMAVAFPGE